MALNNFIILITRKLPEKIEKKLKQKFKVILNKSDKKLSYNEPSERKILEEVLFKTPLEGVC